MDRRRIEGGALYFSGSSNLTADATAVLGDEVDLPDPDRTAGSRRLQRELDICRALDIIIALFVIAFIAPLMCAVCLGIKLQDGGPVLFGHYRIGRHGRSFRCWKFRSMVVNAEDRLAAVLASDPEARAEWEASHKLRTDPRITAFGRFLRVSSLDELPQLLNVLAGEMSLVGPRPIVTSEVVRYGRWFSHYTAVRPGITGLWQINGRSDVSYRERVAMDVLFSRTQSVARYISILICTIPAVLKRSGSY